ncbi:hypothetical protein C2845_PM09G19550 [Panicum miliaceum]|uniref:Secreted protein n=1 Tax=Panicum miliaceum TaxID=4540 RepID=A0A3L6S4S5_PANMI|nr:hypothetical protein C2845_PM09G19550 [Panicum miliaceum]
MAGQLPGAACFLVAFFIPALVSRTSLWASDWTSGFETRVLKAFSRKLNHWSLPGIAVITTEPRNILLRLFYQKSEKLRPKRAAPDNLAPENNNKQPRGPVADVGSQSNARS